MNKAYPVGKAQKMVLDALNVRVESFQEAETYFESIGIMVVPVRVGRTTEPSIILRDGGSFNAYGEGDSWSGGAVDLSKISQWVSK